MKIDDVTTVLCDHDSRFLFGPVEAAAERIMDLGDIATATYAAEEAIRAFQRELERQTVGQLVSRQWTKHGSYSAEMRRQ